MIRAWEGFRFKDDWMKLQQRCMTQDFSWYGSAAEYIKIYKELTGQPGELTSEEEDKISFLIQKNISWDLNGKGNIDENIGEDNTEKESTETQTVIQEESTTVEDEQTQESTAPTDSSTITSQAVEVVTNHNAPEIEESLSQESSTSIITTETEVHQPTSDIEEDQPKLKPRPSISSPTGD